LDEGNGGAIENFGSLLVISRSTFDSNQALGGSNATGGAAGPGQVGDAFGGALLNAGFTTVTDSTFTRNQAIGGNDNTASNGLIEIGWGIGGGIGNVLPFLPGAAQNLTASNLTLRDNQALGGNGNVGGILTGAGLGGASGNWQGATASLTNCTLDHNRAVGGEGEDGGNGGNGLGGGVYNDGSTVFGVSSLTITGSTITHNEAKGGKADDGGSDGQGIGGGAYLASGGNVCFDVFTLTHIKGNKASTSNDDVFGDFTICP
jgi:hypothetical protein